MLEALLVGLSKVLGFFLVAVALMATVYVVVYTVLFAIAC